MKNLKKYRFYDRNQEIVNELNLMFQILRPIIFGGFFALLTIDFLRYQHVLVACVSVMTGVVIYIYRDIFNFIDNEKRVALGTVLYILLAIKEYIKYGLTSYVFLLFLVAMVISMLMLPQRYYIVITAIIAVALVTMSFLNYVGIRELNLDFSFEMAAFARVLMYLLCVFVIVTCVLLFRLFSRAMAYALKNKIQEETELSMERADVIEKLSYTDDLTGLPNRMFFERTIDFKLPNEGCFLVILDMKNFKIINTMYGMGTGEELLNFFGHQLALKVTDHIKCARISGDEFVIFIEAMDREEVLNWIDGLKKEVFHTYAEKHRISFRKIDFYIAFIESTTETKFGQLYDKAGLAMKICKENPKLQYMEYNTEMYTNFCEEEKLLHEIEQAIIDEEFIPYYQKKINPLTGTVVGVEALARWKSKRAGMISPGIFIPIIEKSNLSVDFGKMMLQKVFSDVKYIQERYGELCSVAINVSPSQLLSEDFEEFIMKQKEKFHIDASHIIIEITEDIVIHDLYIAKKILCNLRNKGFQISLDDFGTGYSSLNYLTELPLDEIKIDQSFMRQYKSKPQVLKLIKAMFEIAMAYELSIVTEGIETLEELEAIMDIGDCYIQGFYYSRPEPLRD